MLCPWEIELTFAFPASSLKLFHLLNRPEWLSENIRTNDSILVPVNNHLGETQPLRTRGFPRKLRSPSPYRVLIYSLLIRPSLREYSDKLISSHWVTEVEFIGNDLRFFAHHRRTQYRLLSYCLIFLSNLCAGPTCSFSYIKVTFRRVLERIDNSTIATSIMVSLQHSPPI